jgi:protoheme IX farnesyltransferase
MLAALRITCTLLKLRIGIAIAASALAGVMAAEGSSLSLAQASALALAVLGASGAAGAFNHYYERDLDRRMTRTRSRPFASGLLQPSAWWPVSFAALLAASLVLAFAVGGLLSSLFVFCGAFTYGVVYTVWLKRRSVWNIVLGGLAGSFAVLAGAAAVNPEPQLFPVLLAVVLFLWTPPHFWSLAAAKADDYAEAGVPMLPTQVSERVWTLAILLHTVALVAISLIPLWYGKGMIYGLGAGLGGAWFLWKSVELYLHPSRRAAIGNFLASLVQLTLLILGVMLDSILGSVG